MYFCCKNEKKAKKMQKNLRISKFFCNFARFFAHSRPLWADLCRVLLYIYVWKMGCKYI